MNTSLRTRLSTSHLLVLIIGMVLAGSLTWLAVERVYLATQRENLLAQARLTAAALGDSPVFFEQEEIYSQTTNITPGIHTRLLDEGGAVILGVPFPEGEDPVQVPPGEDPGYVPAEDLVQRTEIQSALSGLAETAIRKVDSLDGRRVLYAAAPVFDQDGNVINLVYLATPLPLQGLPDDLTTQLIAVTLGAIILAGLIGILLARSIAQPLEILDSSAAAVSSGDFTQQTSQHAGIREVDNLNQTFNKMSSNLRFSEQAKNAFIADVTHELRTPLTVIKGTVETLEDGAMDDLDGRDRLLSSLGKESNRMIRLVNNLLTLTRADAKALNLNLKTMDLAEAARERCLALEPLAANKDLHLKVTLASQSETNACYVRADPDRISQVLDNLLDNAIRHAPVGSTITISLTTDSGQVTCSVSDQGPGIPSEHLPFIFERFYRIESARDRSSGGSGLGLAIARSLIEAQGGTMRADSSVGTGTRIIFIIPAIDHPTNIG